MIPKKKNLLLRYCVLAIAILIQLPAYTRAQNKSDKLADKPLFHDPVYDGAADPAIIYNKELGKWWMFYTNRRATDASAKGVTWVHGTRIGIAESTDGAHWKYLDTANINYRPNAGFTHWAPALIESQGVYHMYLTYVPGTFTEWEHPRNIVHLTSTDLMNWKYQSVLKLANDKVIDAYVVKLPDGTFRLWYNNEKDHKSIYYADSKDLYNWVDKGRTLPDDIAGEGPIIFTWKNRNWLIEDNWKGMSVYSSTDFTNWKRQEKRLLETPGTGKEDQVKGNHADVVLNGDRAYIFYFVQNDKRSIIQVAELKYQPDGTLACDRNAPVYIDLKKPKK